MEVRVVHELNGSELYKAGHMAPAGLYREIETRFEVHLEHDDILPASLNGRVAYYERVTLYSSRLLSIQGAETHEAGIRA